MSRYCVEPSQGHDQQDETRVQSIPDFPVKAGFTGESDKFRSPSALARANAGFEAMAPCYGWRSPHTRGALSPGPASPRGGGSSPHTRGARVQHQPVKAQPRIIPAYAGSTTGRTAGEHRHRDHPRIRGEHRILPAGQTLPGGSSPHTRGAPDHAERSLHCPGIIPAYAGSTHIDSRFFQLKRDHPRIRGEHRAPLPTPARAHGSSPHTRGAP